MYKNILVALENSRADKSLLPHVQQLAKLLGSHLLLVHVADGWAARTYDQLKLTESEEMRADRNYLDERAEELRRDGLSVSVQLALGDPPTELLKIADSEHCDLIAMAAHGHRLVGDLILGSTIHVVRHKTSLPVLLVRAAEK
jgi:nucleotide-binding universal stress UspA family protein